MKTLLLEIEKRSIKTAQKVEQKLLWYNSVTGKMEEFYGGKLSFRYNLETNQNVPYIEDVYSIVYKPSDTKEYILRWAKTNYKFVKISEEQPDRNHIAIEVDDDNLEFVESSLYSAGIRYD